MSELTAPFHDIRRRIRDDILAGILPFGARVTIDELAARYGVSHMPVREALRELNGEGLVVTERHRGARVREIDARFIENLFDIRGALETLLAKRAAMRCTKSDVEAAIAIEDQLEDAVARGDYSEVLHQNRAFHSSVNRIAGNPDAEALLERHWVLIASLWRRFGYGPERYAGVASDHRALIRALAGNDADGAVALMTAHVVKAKQELIARMAGEPGFRKDVGQ